jgi:hypothetical protein
MIAASEPTGWLRRLADFLALDWPWLRRRCRELAEIGVAGIAEPRSRHRSVDGVDRACWYLARLDDGTPLGSASGQGEGVEGTCCVG